MSVDAQAQTDVSAELIDAIRGFPLEREVEHCGNSWSISSFAIYAICPQCHSRIKVRSFAANPEIEDVFDAVFEWMNQPGAQRLAEERMTSIAADPD